MGWETVSITITPLYNVLVLLIIAAVRVVFIQLTKGFGLDVWYWHLYIDKLRRERRFPVSIDRFLLDIREQWYPPIFPILVALIPGSVSQLSRWLPLILDVLTTALIMVITGLLVHHWLPVVVAGLIYGITPIIVQYNSTLNPRALGNILFIIFMMGVWSWLKAGTGWWLLLLAFILAVILLTHKMTSQLVAFVLSVLAVCHGQWLLLALLPAAMILAWLVSGGFYSKVLRAHWDIVKFWHRNHSKLGAHQFYDSDLYRLPDHTSSYLLHRPGLRGILHHTMYLLGYNPFVIILAWIWLTSDSSIRPFFDFWFELTVLIYALAILTSFIPWLKCFGSGQQYIYYTAGPLALTGAQSLEHGWTGFLPLVLAGTIALVIVVVIYWRVYHDPLGRWHDEALDQIIHNINKHPGERLWCIPLYPSDKLAYTTGKKILWGAHGYGFERLSPIYPVMQISIEEAVKHYGVDLILLNTSYFPEFEKYASDKLALRLLQEVGKYRLYEVAQ